jgi:branched-chain amino acid aminotransferase
MLTEDGHVSEGSAENIFLARDGVLGTPPPSDSILEGITRAAVMRVARDLGIPCVERRIDRTELYIADEIFLTGTGAQIAAVTSVDRRPVGDGGMGPFTQRIRDVYFDAVRGKIDRYRSWLTPVLAAGDRRQELDLARSR